MKVVLREDESGVSEVVGTILILAMTVVLFSTIIIWVSSIPTPVAQTRADIQSSLVPQYVSGSETGDWVNLTHQGGEALPSASTVLYITDNKGSGAPTTDVVHLSKYRCKTACPPIGNGVGLLDGPGSSWSVGQRFSYYNTSFRVQDTISVTIVDLTRSLVVWNAVLNPPAGTRPPVFVNAWTSRLSSGTPITPVAGEPFYVLAHVVSPDNAVASVTATITYYYNRAGAPNCIARPLNDDGANGDASAGDGIFTLFDHACTGQAWPGMDGSLILLNATDVKGHLTTTRLVMHVLPGSNTQGNNTDGFGGSGRPPNLRWNGNQGYNIFNATQWDTFHYAATPTRTFKGNETVVLVVGSLSLQNVFGVNQFNLLDPYSGNPAQDVVYGAMKSVGPASIPSTTSAFTFFNFVNGYYIYSYRFELNSAAAGTNFYTTPPQYPRYYYFANYPLSVLLTDSANDRFTTTDSINVTSNLGGLRTFPSIQTFSDAHFTQPASQFHSTATVYVQVNMLSANLNGSYSTNGQVLVGNVLIKDFSGGQELNRAPTTVSGSSVYANLPICPPLGSCSSSVVAIWSDQATHSYRFAINLARVNQDPWVAGTQNYALTLSSIRDFDESYASVSAQIVVQAPLYKMDLLTGNGPATNNAWGTKDYAYFYQDYNGFDAWKKLRVDYCTGPQTVSGLPSSGQGKCPGTSNVVVAFGDFWHDGTLGAAEGISAGSGGTNPANAVVIYRRTVDATGAITYLPTFWDFPATACNAIAAGDVTGNGMPSVICGSTNGYIWYYANNGNWTKAIVDQPAAGQQINSLVVADFNGDGWNDIAVGGVNGYLLWYPNLGYGRFQNPGIVDNWNAIAEQSIQGNVTAGSYLSTYGQDGNSEQIKESPVSIPLLKGYLVNSYFNTTAAPWTPAQAYGTSTEAWASLGGNPGGFAQITDVKPAANGLVAGYWWQPFTVQGSPAFTVALQLNYQVATYGAGTGGSVTFYAFVDNNTNVPTASPACSATGSGACWSSGAITASGPWTTADFTFTGRVPSPGRYYLKVAMYTNFFSGTVNTVGGVDNVFLNWTSTGGDAFETEHYWRFATLPSRANTAFTFNLFAGASSTQGTFTAESVENFQFAYSTNVVGTDPTTGTYLPMGSATVSGAMAPRQFNLPAAVGGLTVWVRVTDANRTVGEPGPMTLFVDLMNINANTQSGRTSVSMLADGSTINMIDAQDANHDGYADLVAGTANANVFKYMGSAGGLVASGQWYTAGGPVIGVKWGNFTTLPAPHGLDIALAFGTTIQIVSGNVARQLIFSGLSWAPWTPNAITAFAVGDINGDGWDDIAVGTGTGQIVLWENLGQATSWTYAVQVDSLGAPIYTLVLGASTNSQYVGR